MSNAIVYNIPATQIDAYPGRNLIIRSAVPEEIVYGLWRANAQAIRFVQLLSPRADCSALEPVGEALPIEIVLKNPALDYVQLYNYATLLDTHPMRITIPVMPGFSKAVKLAVSLNFAVKLQVDQPDDSLIGELMDVLDLYLHKANVRQPIEFFQSLMLSFFQQQPTSLWEILEEEPTLVRYVTDDGEETISNRFAGTRLKGGVEDFVYRYGQELLSEKRECHECEFFNRCGGYFKWPDKNYKCAGIKKLFRTIESAAQEIRHDLEACPTPERPL